MRRAVVVAFLLVALVPVWAYAAGNFVLFDGGIGVIPVSRATGTGTIDANGNNVFPDVVRNDIVRAGVRVAPGGQPWVIARLTADIKTDGRISVDGRGLLLAGGAIGTNGGQKVFATLFCGDTQHDSDPAGVPLEANGDFGIDDVLSNLPLPAVCDNPVLLIRSTGGAWFAAGIQKL